MIKYQPAEDKTEDIAWNNFYPEAWKEFKESLGKALEMVDVIPPKSSKKNTFNAYEYWKNDNDTVVFTLNTSRIEPLAMVSLVMRTNVDEFDYVLVDKNKYVVRMWWD
jgi:hypothetical protein